MSLSLSLGAATSEDLHWSSTRPSLTYAVAHARSQYGDDEAGEGDAARQDHMSAHDLRVSSETPLLIKCSDTQDET